jgi:hypothetical protein
MRQSYKAALAHGLITVGKWTKRTNPDYVNKAHQWAMPLTGFSIVSEFAE